MSDILEVNEKNFKAEVLDKEGKVLVDFWAPWCGPCRMQAPILERVLKTEGVKAGIVKLNTDENPKIAQQFGINSIPTLILFQNGKELERMIGVQPETALTAKLK